LSKHIEVVRQSRKSSHRRQLADQAAYRDHAVDVWRRNERDRLGAMCQATVTWRARDCDAVASEFDLDMKATVSVHDLSEHEIAFAPRHQQALVTRRRERHRHPGRDVDRRHGLPGRDVAGLARFLIMCRSSWNHGHEHEGVTVLSPESRRFRIRSAKAFRSTVGASA
jgi:hypothetical protein